MATKMDWDDVVVCVYTLLDGHQCCAPLATSIATGISLFYRLPNCGLIALQTYVHSVNAS